MYLLHITTVAMLAITMCHCVWDNSGGDYTAYTMSFIMSNIMGSLNMGTTTVSVHWVSVY